MLLFKLHPVLALFTLHLDIIFLTTPSIKSGHKHPMLVTQSECVTTCVQHYNKFV